MLEEEDEDINNPTTLTGDMPHIRIPEMLEEVQKPPDRGDIETPFELENIPLLELLARQIEERDPEEIILGGENKVVDQETNGINETIIQLEDGSYKKMNTEDVYNHMSNEYQCEDIAELISPKYSVNTGKLYITVKWRDGHESIIDADTLKRDEPLRLARFIHNHPVE